jgi:putative transposase
MMTPTAFQQWCKHLALPASTCKLLADIRSGDPVRRVTSRASNMSGAYPSDKMGMTIQFESHKVEFWAILVMERDPDVLEFYDQPHRFKLQYQSGKKMVGPYYTPDFLVLRRTSVAFEEWKTEEDLRKLSARIPTRYQRTIDGQWHCPPAEAYTQPLGLTFRLRSSAELNPTYVENLFFLADYVGIADLVPEQVQTHISQRIREMPGLPLSALAHEGSGVRPNDVYAMLANDLLYTDLKASLLIQHRHVRLYLSLEQAGAYAHLQPARLLSRVGSPFPEVTAPLTTNTTLLWDGCSWTLVNPGETTTTLLPEKGPLMQIPSASFHQLVDTGVITPLRSPDDLPATAPEVDQFMDHASSSDLRQANERFVVVTAYLQGEKEKYAAIAPRTLHRWVARYREAEAQFGSGYVGLLTRKAKQGNHIPKAPQASRDLMDTFITEQFETPRRTPAAAVYRSYEQACLKQGITPVSVRAFYDRIKQRATPQQTEQREGSRAAYQEIPWFWELEYHTPRHGSRPFEIAHIDHTELDIEIRSSLTGQLLGRPWVTFMMDAYSRRFLAVYLTFDPPSYRSVMMALRICVQRFERLPQCIVVDGGKEFHSVYFDTLLARNHCTKKARPWAKPHFGSVIERLFDTTNTQFIYTLLGNTQAAKRARMMTKAVDPKHHALWTLPDLYTYLLEYAYQVYDQNEHGGIGLSPQAAYLWGMKQGGEREHKRIAYNERFLKDTCPTTAKETAIVQRGSGVKINYFYYWNKDFRNPEVIKKAVPVRYDPFDITTAYAQIEGEWVTCRSPFAQLEGHTERELHVATEELRKQAKRDGVRTSITSARLVELMEKAAAHEALFTQQLCDLEGKKVQEIMSSQSGSPRTLAPGSALLPLPSRLTAEIKQMSTVSMPVDIERLPILGDYR